MTDTKKRDSDGWTADTGKVFLECYSTQEHAFKTVTDLAADSESSKYSEAINIGSIAKDANAEIVLTNGTQWQLIEIEIDSDASHTLTDKLTIKRGANASVASEVCSFFARFMGLRSLRGLPNNTLSDNKIYLFSSGTNMVTANYTAIVTYFAK